MRVLHNSHSCLNDFHMISASIQSLLESGYRRFIVYPFGEQGVKCVDILKTQFGIAPYKIADKNISRYNSKVMAPDDLRHVELGGNDVVVLLNSKSYQKELIECIEDMNVDVWIVFQEKTARPKSEYPYPVGRYTTIPESFHAYDYVIESIGSFCSLAIGSCVVPNHPLDTVTTSKFLWIDKTDRNSERALVEETPINRYTINKKTIIGNDVWLGRNVLLMNGIKIGDGAIIGAGAVVTHDIPDYSIAAGIPARVIKFRFRDEQIQKLKKIRWWDWDMEKIKRCYMDFYDIEIFLEKHYREEM